MASINQCDTFCGVLMVKQFQRTDGGEEKLSIKSFLSKAGFDQSQLSVTLLPGRVWFIDVRDPVKTRRKKSEFKNRERTTLEKFHWNKYLIKKSELNVWWPELAITINSSICVICWKIFWTVWWISFFAISRLILKKHSLLHHYPAWSPIVPLISNLYLLIKYAV